MIVSTFPVFKAHARDSGALDDIINSLRVGELNLITVSINALDFISF